MRIPMSLLLVCAIGFAIGWCLPAAYQFILTWFDLDDEEWP